MQNHTRSFLCLLMFVSFVCLGVKINTHCKTLKNVAPLLKKTVQIKFLQILFTGNSTGLTNTELKKLGYLLPYSSSEPSNNGLPFKKRSWSNYDSQYTTPTQNQCTVLPPKKRLKLVNQQNQSVYYVSPNSIPPTTQ